MILLTVLSGVTKLCGFSVHTHTHTHQQLLWHYDHVGVLSLMLFTHSIILKFSSSLWSSPIKLAQQISTDESLIINFVYVGRKKLLSAALVAQALYLLEFWAKKRSLRFSCLFFMANRGMWSELCFWAVPSVHLILVTMISTLPLGNFFLQFHTNVHLNLHSLYCLLNPHTEVCVIVEHPCDT